MITEQTTSKLQINTQRAGELTSAILQKPITEARFRINLSPQDALDMLAAFYDAEVRRRLRQTVWDENTVRALVSLAGHLTLPIPKFGVLCCGTCGNGKTTLMLAFQQMLNYLGEQNHFSFLDEDNRKFDAAMRIYDVKEIVWLARTDYRKYKDVMQSAMIGIDDLGKEPAEILDYGNVLSPVIDLIEHRYSRQLFTFATTNLTARGRRSDNEDNDGSIRGKYKDRIADRFNEMFHTIVFKDITYRKLQTHTYNDKTDNP